MQGRGPKSGDSAPDIGANELKDTSYRHGDGRSGENPLPHAEKRNQHGKLQRVDQIVHQLDGGSVQAEQDGGQKAQNGRRSDNRGDAERDSEGDAQRDLLGRDALAQQVQEQVDDSAAPDQARLNRTASTGSSARNCFSCSNT